MTADTDIAPFFLQNFVSTVPGTTPPVTEFPSGADIALSWDSNGTAFTVYAAKDGTPVYSGNETSCVVSGGRTSATTFVLVASVSGGAGSGAPYPGFETINLVDALTVTISNPTLTPAAVTAGSLAVTGASVLADATLASATVGGTLDVSGAATLSGGAAVNGLSVTGGATLAGGATLDSATVSGPLTAATTNLGNASAATLAVSSWVSMLSPRGLAPGNYSASSDGLVVGSVGYPSDAGKKCSAIAYGWSAATGYLYATGGNDVMWTNGDSSWMWIVGNTFVLPVSRGAAFQVGVMQVNGADLPAPTSFAWVPFGTNAQVTSIDDDAAAAAGAAPPSLPEPVPPTPFEPDLAIGEILDVLAEVVGAPIAGPEADRLAAAVRALATHSTVPPS
jgi:hypothetical protein